MKNTLALIIFFCVTLAFGQAKKTIPGSFNIIGNSHPAKADFYSDAILNSDLEPYRLKDSRVKLQFKNGFELELLSAKELFVKGVQIDIGNYRVQNDSKVPLPLFVVFDNGTLGAEIKTTDKTGSK